MPLLLGPIHWLSIRPICHFFKTNGRSSSRTTIIKSRKLPSVNQVLNSCQPQKSRVVRKKMMMKIVLRSISAKTSTADGEAKHRWKTRWNSPFALPSHLDEFLWPFSSAAKTFLSYLFEFTTLIFKYIHLVLAALALNSKRTWKTIVHYVFF